MTRSSLLPSFLGARGMLLWFLFMLSMLTSLVAQSGSSSVQANSLITLDGTSLFTNTNNILSSLSVTTTS
eukprot:gene1921-2250_t